MNIADLSFLAVEDHEFQRAVLVRMLTALGATRLSSAADGAQALKILQAHSPPIDIIISDLDMPGMDGMEFVRHLGEAAFPGSIILASAVENSLLASVETMAEAYGVRILGTIRKPVSPIRLEALIRLHEARAAHRISFGDDASNATGPAFSLDEIATGLKDDQFEPFFHPKVDVATGRIKGAEALARWRHPQQGLVAPAAFIGLLEQNDHIDALTRIMLRRSAAFCNEWRAASGQDVTVSVNLSVKLLDDVHLAERVTDLVHSEHLEPRCMILEVTESATTIDVAMALENLSRLRMKGFGLSIDNYGTRHSTMQQLARIAFTEIKIDRSFVAHAATQPSARVILESSLEMAKKLSMASVAVGVETDKDWAVLRQLGCEMAQGHWIAKPVRAAAFLRWSAQRALAAK